MIIKIQYSMYDELCYMHIHSPSNKMVDIVIAARRDVFVQESENEKTGQKMHADDNDKKDDFTNSLSSKGRVDLDN